MHQDMTHPFYLTPIHFCVRFAKLGRKHIDSFAYYLNKLCESIKDEFVSLYVFESIQSMKLLYAFYGFENMLQSAFVLNFLSHKSEVCHDWLSLGRKAGGILPRQYPLCA